MPRQLRLRVASLGRLAQQLRYAPPAACRRCVQRAEGLARTIDPDRSYTLGWITGQVTGFVPGAKGKGGGKGWGKGEGEGEGGGGGEGRGGGDDAETIPGAALLADLAGLIDRLCAGARYGPLDLPGNAWMTIDEVRTALGVSRRTVERLRPRGLIGRRVTLVGGRVRVVIARELAARFIAQAQARAAERAGRVAGQTARRGTRVAPDAPVARAATRAVAGGSFSTRHRARLRPVVQRLAELRVAVPERYKDVSSVELANALAAAEVRTGLGGPGEASAAELVAGAAQRGWPDKDVERRRAVAAWGLIARAQLAARGLSLARPSAAVLDRAVTDLRWASRLRAELARGTHLTVLRSVEVTLGKPLVELADPERVRGELHAAVARGVERFDPSRGGRLAAPVGLELSRVLAPSGGASGGSTPGAQIPGAQPSPVLVLEDWTRAIDPWQGWTEPGPHVRAGLAGLDDRDALLLRLRYGWAGGPPLTCVEVGVFLGLPSSVVRRRERALMGG